MEYGYIYRKPTRTSYNRIHKAEMSCVIFIALFEDIRTKEFYKELHEEQMRKLEPYLQTDEAALRKLEKEVTSQYNINDIPFAGLK